MQLPATLIDRLPFDEALDRVGSQRGGLLPASVGAQAAKLAGSKYIEWLQARLTDDLPLHEAEVVFAQRHGSGTRPVADLGIDARLILEALAIAVSESLTEDAAMLGLADHLAAPEPGTRISFERAPAEDSTAAFVVKADVASFYEYVDHELLGREILELAADVNLSSAVAAVLASVMGRRYGLPQGPQGSDSLASLYLSAVDRRLLRSGVRFDRFNDDYLLRCGSLPEARRHLLELEVELRGIGLILNHQKTHILSREKYEEGLQALQDILAEAAIESVELPLGYSFDPDEFSSIDLDSADQPTIETAFQKALDDDELQYEVRRRLVDGALPYLAGFGSLDPLDRLGELVDRFPSQIRNVNLYLRSLIGGDDEGTMITAVASLLSSEPSQVPWVGGWLADVLARGTIFSRAVVPWLRGAAIDVGAPWFLRTRALIAAARAGAFLSQTEVAALFRAAPEANRPDIVAAVALSGADWSEPFLQSLKPAHPVLRCVPDLLTQEPARTAL